MIVWVQSDDGGRTVLTGFDGRLRERVKLIEDENEWEIHINSGIERMPADGTPDPIEFVMRLISPRKRPRDSTEAPFLLFKNHDTGEAWEVWEVR